MGGGNDICIYIYQESIKYFPVAGRAVPVRIRLRLSPDSQNPAGALETLPNPLATSVNGQPPYIVDAPSVSLSLSSSVFSPHPPNAGSQSMNKSVPQMPTFRFSKKNHSMISIDEISCHENGAGKKWSPQIGGRC